MAKNYLHIPAEGQLDITACWAACLKWWFKAVKSINKSQRRLIGKYNYLADDYGAMQPDEIQYIIVDNNMYIETLDRAAQFTADLVRDRLRFGPLYVAFTETSEGGRHVNVIYGIDGSNRVSVMEPQAHENEDLSFRGEHQLKPLSEFNQIGSVFFGYK
jgi:hypothetical protein